MSLKNTNLPVIDVSSIYTARTSSDLTKLAKSLLKVYSNIGFAYIVGHGITPCLLNSVFEQSRLFHHLPEEEKLKISQNKFFRGYMPIGASTLKISTLGSAKYPNHSASYILMNEVDRADSDYKQGRNFAGPNQWPKAMHLPNFKNVLSTYREEITVLAKKIIRLFSLGLTNDYYYLDRYFLNPTTFLRLQFYPSQPKSMSEGQFGIAPHTDYGFITLLAQDKTGGLQVRSSDEKWIDAPPMKNSLIMNSGDMLAFISSNLIKSTRHRVINTSNCNRYSVPFFFEPDIKSTIIPIINNTLIKSINYEEYAMARVYNNYKVTH